MRKPAPRLAVVTNDYPPKPGGIQQYLGNLVDAYPGEVVVLGPADGPAAGTRRGEAVVRRNSSRFMWPSAAVADWIAAELRNATPDAVLFGAPHPLTALASVVRGAVDGPVGVLCHGAEVTIPAAFPASRHLLARWLGAVDVRFAVSRFTADRVRRLTGRATVYLGAGVDLDGFVETGPAGNVRPVVACVSRFVPRKGQDRLINAVARVRAEGMPWEVLLVGKGRNERALRRLAARRGVPAAFAVDVPWEQLPALYGAADAFCMPCSSRWGGLEIEGLGLVYLEAAATGLPVLAGDSGGSPETVVPGTTGFVVHDVHDIVQGLEILGADPERGVQMGHAGRVRVEAEFTWERVASRLVDGFAAV